MIHIKQNTIVKFFDEFSENNNSVEYTDIYEHYNEQYKSLCSHVKFQIKPTLVAINEHYFEREFKAEL